MNALKYGYFDDLNREYVVEKVDTPVSWTNYLGVKDFCAVLNQTAGGYCFYKSPEYHRITRFRPNGVAMDFPGHYVYLRDDESGDYWSVSWQPVGKPLDQASYTCRHGLSYSKYLCDYNGVEASQTVFVPVQDNVELWDVKLKNTSARSRTLSVFSYVEFSFHHIEFDNQNFQMSLYCAGSDYKDGVIQYDLFYEQDGFQYMTANFEPDGYDCLRDSFIGQYRTERNPLVVEQGNCTSSSELGNNHCGTLQKKVTLQPGEETRLIFMLGEGSRETGLYMKERYSDLNHVDAAFDELAEYWDKKLSKLQVKTPNKGMNTLINHWTLYQSEINVMFSRFASFIEVGGRTGLGYRDTAQDAMAVPHSNPQKCRQRLVELLRGLTSTGYGLHLFRPEWFDPDHQEKKEAFKSPTVVPTPSRSGMVHGLEDACGDDALWLVGAIVEYIRETGETEFVDQVYGYADTTPEHPIEGTVYEHMKRILDFSASQVGPDGICKSLRADWNDCINLGDGESAMVSFLHYWAMEHFIDLAKYLGRQDDVEKYTALSKKVAESCEKNLWDDKWYIRGITKQGHKLGSHQEDEGKIHLESNTWAVLSGVSTGDRAHLAMDSVEENLYTPYGLMLNGPAYSKPNDDIGFITRVYKGVKENASIFSHPNPWAWVAEAKLGRGNKAMKYYDALCPYNQNDIIEMRQAEPYSYCQFIMGPEHTAFGRARHPFMTGSGGWAYYAATKYLLGVRPSFDSLEIDPCVPSDWKEFQITRIWRGAEYNIQVQNPNGVQKGIVKVTLNGLPCTNGKVPVCALGSENTVIAVMG